MNTRESGNTVEPASSEKFLGKTHLENYVNPVFDGRYLAKQTGRTNTYVEEVGTALRTHANAFKENSTGMVEKQTKLFGELAKDFAKEPKPSDLSDYLNDFAQ